MTINGVITTLFRPIQIPYKFVLGYHNLKWAVNPHALCVKGIFKKIPIHLQDPVTSFTTLNRDIIIYNNFFDNMFYYNI
jgi:hypothetical protein